LSHPLLPTVISTNIFNAFQISPEQFAQQLKQTTQEKEDDEEKKTLSQKQACIVQSADMYLQVKKKTQKQEQLKVFESMANSLMEPTTTDTTKEGDVLMLDHEQQHQSSDVGEFLIKLSALNIAQKQELDMMNQLCTEFVDQLQQTLKINQNNEQGDQSSQYNKKPEQLFSELKKKYSGQVLQVHTLDKKSTSVGVVQVYINLNSCRLHKAKRKRKILQKMLQINLICGSSIICMILIQLMKRKNN